ncbi:MAG: DUF5666 domain-containing protein [Chloroflexota bacterium]
MMIKNKGEKMNRKISLLSLALPVLMAGMLILSACQVKTEDIQGLLQAMAGKEMVITLSDGSTVRVTVEDTQLGTQAQNLVGTQVQVKIRSDSQRLTSISKVGENDHFSGIIESMGSDAWVIGGKTFKVDAATSLDGGLAVGVLAQVEFVTMADGSLLATEIETDEEEDQFTGVIQSISTDTWVIGGKTFKVNAQTKLDEGLLVGVQVRVEFVTKADGSLEAIEIETEQAEDRFNGVVQTIGADSWVIGGKTFKVNAATRFESGLAVSINARVRFITLADSSTLATRIQVDKSGKGRGGLEEREQFTGAVQTISADAWVIGGKTLKVNVSTNIEAGLAVGSDVRVRYAILADGSLQAIRIEKNNSGSR